MTVRTLPSGHLLVDVHYRHPDGTTQRVRKEPPTQTPAGAKAFEKKVLAALARGEYRKRGTKTDKSPTVEDFSKTFLKHTKVNRKASVLRTYGDSLRLHILPRFGQLRLDELGFDEVEELKAELLEAEYEKKSIQNQIGVLSSMLRLAVKTKKISGMPQIDWFKLPKYRDEPALTEEQFQRLHDAAEPEWRLMMRFAVLQGLRIGELCELRWDDIDLVEQWIRVDRAVYRGTVDDPKHSKRRGIPLLPELVSPLRAHRRPGVDFVFSEPNGTQLKPYGRPSKAIARAARVAQLGRFVGWHLLRHTWATWLARKGVGGPALMKLGGWADLSQVQRYVNLHEEDLRSAIGRLGSTTPQSMEKAP